MYPITLFCEFLFWVVSLIISGALVAERISRQEYHTPELPCTVVIKWSVAMGTVRSMSNALEYTPVSNEKKISLGPCLVRISGYRKKFEGL